MTPGGAPCSRQPRAAVETDTLERRPHTHRDLPVSMGRWRGPLLPQPPRDTRVSADLNHGAEAEGGPLPVLPFSGYAVVRSPRGAGRWGWALSPAWRGGDRRLTAGKHDLVLVTLCPESPVTRRPGEYLRGSSVT